MKFFKQLASLIKGFLKRIYILLGFLLVLEIAKLANPYLFKLVIDRIIAFNTEDINELVIFIILIFVAENVLMVAYNFSDKHIFRVVKDMETYLLGLAQSKLMELSLDYHEKENTGDKISKIERGVDRLLDFIADSIWEFLPTVFQLIITFFAILWLNWQLAFVFVAFIPPYVWLSYKMVKKQRPLRKRVNKLYEKSSGHLSENIINIQTVQGHGSESFEKRKYHGILRNLFTIHWRSFNTFLNYNLSRSLLLNIGRAGLIGFGVFLTARGSITPGGLVMFVTLSEKVYLSIFRVFRIFDRLMDSKETADRLIVLLKTDSKVKIPANPVKPRLKGMIEFKNVSFCYPSGFCAIKKLNLTVQPGEKIAIVGPSGGGKTTIAKLIYRHYDVTSGKILVDGHNIMDYDLTKYRKQLGMVMQDIGIFNRSIFENIAYGLKRTTKDRVIAAARTAQADEFIISLDKGYNSLVGERGIKLSGGQRQRIGIARAIIRDPKVLIFDEATSSLDADSESKIQEAIKDIGKGRTMIVIAHRLSTIRSMDRIIVIEKGQLVEQGTHEDLSKSKGLYYRLNKLQTDYQLRT